MEDAIIHNHPDCKLAKAFNGEEGLKILEILFEKDDLPNLIISDLNMPLMDGLEIYKEIKKDIRFSHIPIVIFTTSSFSKSLFSEKGIIAYTKPFSLSEFEKVVVDIVETTRQC